MRFRVSFEFDIDRTSAHMWVDDEQGVSSVEELVDLLFKSEDLEAEEVEVERID